MRVNLPVTNKEHHLKDGATLVSKTDLKGVITYVNGSFIEVSGFTEEELLGGPHNIVRHPDMPPEAFEDLYRTMQAGKSWRAMVKNRCKNGDHYWVEANANPIREGGKIVGYMSLRTKPTRTQVEEAERIYKAMRDGKARHLAVREGRVVRTGALGALQRLARLTVRGRLIMLVALLCLVAVGAGGLGLAGMSRTNESLRAVYQQRLIPTGEISGILQRVMENRALLLDAIAKPTSKTISTNGAKIEQNKNEITLLWKKYMANDLTPDEKRLAGQWARARAHFVKDGLLAGLADLRAGKVAEARHVAQTVMEPAYAPVRDGAQRLFKLQLKAAKRQYTSSLSNFASSRDVILFGVGGAVLLAVWLAAVLIRAVINPLNRATVMAEAVSSGNLNARVEVNSDDELGKLMRSLNAMVGNLIGIVTDVGNAADTVHSRAAEISQGNSDLSQRTEEQAASLEETASSMEEMTATVNRNAANAKEADQVATGARAQAEKGGEVVSRAVSAMQEINQSSNKIADIIGVIDDIAFQTNLLALNAAVEAARAGEQGRGFAVVAGEVRNLAQRSAEAAKEIKSLIQDSVGKVNQGSELVTASGDTLEEIVTSVKRMADLVGEIAGASQEQASGVEQVGKAVTQMDQVTQQNAALVEQAAAASRDLEERATYLQRMMGFFSVPGGQPRASAGGGGAARTKARRARRAARQAARAEEKQS